MTTPADFRRFADRVRGITGGIPIGFKLSANHIEADIDFANEAGADYIILDSRGGGTSKFAGSDLTTWKREMADLTGIGYAGVGA